MASKTPKALKAAPAVRLLGVKAQAGYRLARLHNDADAPLELLLGGFALVTQRYVQQTIKKQLFCIAFPDRAAAVSSYSVFILFPD